MIKLTTIIIGLTFLTSFDSHSQFIGTDTLHINYIKNQFDTSKDFMNSWIYFNLNDTIELKIIHHISATMDCNRDIKTFSITIGTIQSGDTIRVLELCNRRKGFNLGEKVFLIPSFNPEEYYTHPGVFVQGYQGQLRPSYYDTKILKTTYGILKRQ
jgi:hypothetical protein